MEVRRLYVLNPYFPVSTDKYFWRYNKIINIYAYHFHQGTLLFLPFSKVKEM